MSLIPLSKNPRGGVLLIVQTIFIFLDVLAVAARIWARHLKKKSLEFNDWSVIVALVIMLARYANEISMVIVTGFGLHAKDIAATYGPEKLVEFGKMSYANDLLWITLVTIIKLSILDLYVKIFRQPLFVKITWVVFALCATTGTSFILTEALICRPVSLFWDISAVGTCGNINLMYRSLATIDLILDLVVVFLPMPMLWSLKLPVSKKVALSAIFGISAAICCITAIRLKFISEIDPTDATYSQLKFNIFAALEPLLGIINCCLPVLPPVLAKVFRSPAFLSSRSRRQTTGDSSSRGGDLRKNYGARSSGLVSSASTGRPFERLEDEYPLTNMHRDAKGEKGGIQVSTQLDVEYSSLSDGPGSRSSREIPRR